MTPEESKARAKLDAAARAASAPTSQVNNAPPQVYRVPRMNMPKDLAELTQLLHGELTKIEQSQSLILSIYEQLQAGAPEGFAPPDSMTIGEDAAGDHILSTDTLAVLSDVDLQLGSDRHIHAECAEQFNLTSGNGIIMIQPTRNRHGGAYGVGYELSTTSDALYMDWHSPSYVGADYSVRMASMDMWGGTQGGQFNLWAGSAKIQTLHNEISLAARVSAANAEMTFRTHTATETGQYYIYRQSVYEPHNGQTPSYIDFSLGQNTGTGNINFVCGTITHNGVPVVLMPQMEAYVGMVVALELAAMKAEIMAEVRGGTTVNPN